MDLHDDSSAEARRDEEELARFGYRQELRRSLGLFSSFAVAFSYISPSTGIFALWGLVQRHKSTDVVESAPAAAL